VIKLPPPKKGFFPETPINTVCGPGNPVKHTLWGPHTRCKHPGTRLKKTLPQGVPRPVKNPEASNPPGLREKRAPGMPS